MRSGEKVLSGAAPEVLHILALDEFGLAVGAALQELTPWTVLVACSYEQLLHAPDLSTALACLLVSGHPASRLCHLLNRLSYEYGVPFLPAVISSPYLDLGPVVIPGTGACYACYERRFLQHAESPLIYKKLFDYYDAHEIPDPSGYLQPLVFLTATRLVQMVVQSLETPERAGGSRWRWNIVHAEALQSQVVGIHGCLYCGLKRDEKVRSFQDMQNYLQQILPWEIAPATFPDSPAVPALAVLALPSAANSQEGGD